MTAAESKELARIIEAAKKIAMDNGISMAVVDHLYCEHDYERFQYAPTTGINTLFMPSHYALIGVIDRTGELKHAGEILFPSRSQGR